MIAGEQHPSVVVLLEHGPKENSHRKQAEDRSKRGPIVAAELGRRRDWSDLLDSVKRLAHGEQ